MFVPNKEFGQWINNSPHSLTMLKTINSDFSFIHSGMNRDKKTQPLEIENKLNTMLVIG